MIDPATPRPANPTATPGASCTSPARTSWTPRTCPTAPSPRSRITPSRSSGFAACTSTRPRIRVGRGPVPGLLSAARGMRLRRFVDVRRPGGLHPGQPDRRREGQAHGGRHAGRPHGPASGFGSGTRAPGRPWMSSCSFMNDIMPYVERTTASIRTGSTAPWRACRWAGARR